MSNVTFDVAVFRVQFPEFANPALYPDALLQARWNEAALYISTENCGYLVDAARAYAVQIMTAHLQRLADLLSAAAASGGQSTVGVVTQATIDKVSVTLAPPPGGSSAWAYWLNLTPYGQQLAAFLRMQATGGFYVGGLPERAAFRKVAGVF